jgi:hypothetical protein
MPHSRSRGRRRDGVSEPGQYFVADAAQAPRVGSHFNRPALTLTAQQCQNEAYGCCLMRCHMILKDSYSICRGFWIRRQLHAGRRYLRWFGATARLLC